MGKDTRTKEELKRDILRNQFELALWEQDDKRLKNVKYNLVWYRAIIARDTAELERRRGE